MKPPRKQYRLMFEDDPVLAGLEVTMRGLSFQAYMKAARHMAGLKDLAAGQSSDSGVAAADTLLALMAKSLVSWNLEDDDGQPLPATAESLQDQDLGLVLAVLEQWIGAIGGVAPPLPASSNGGGTYPEASIPMVPLSPSPSSS